MQRYHFFTSFGTPDPASRSAKTAYFVLFATPTSDFPHPLHKTVDRRPQNGHPALVPGLSSLGRMIWNKDYMNSMGDLPKEVQEEIMEMQDRDSSETAHENQPKGRIFKAVKHFLEKLNLLFKKKQGATA